MNDDVSKKSAGDKPGKRRSASTEDDEPTFNTVLSPSEETSDDSEALQRSNGISRQSAMLLFFIATITGGAVGWIGPNLFSNTNQKIEKLQSALTQAEQQLAEAEKSQGQLTNQISEILTEGHNNGTTARAANNKIVKLEREIEAMKANAGSFDDSQQLAALNERISALTAFSGTEIEGGENILALVNRLEALEARADSLDELDTRISSLEAIGLSSSAIAFPTPDETPIAIPEMETAQDQKRALQVLIDTFPRTKMLEAVKAQEVIASKKPSWLQRTLSRHVKVRDDDQIDPTALIDEAETALRQGEITQALEIIAKLNPPVRSIAADWTMAAKKAAKTIEKDL